MSGHKNVIETSTDHWRETGWYQCWA